MTPRLTLPSLVGLRLAKTRRKLQLTLRDLESMSGVSNAAISQIETGHIQDPGIGTIAQIAESLGLRPAWLAYGVGAMRPKRGSA